MHYHICNWNDGQSPKQVNGTKFILDKFVDVLVGGGIPVVHCSAGVGRTGTLIAMAVLKLLVQNNQSISVFEEVRKLREQRWGMVYTSSQYDYLY